MIQYYRDLELQVGKIQEEQLAFGQIQKIYSTAYFISLAIRSPGKTWHLYIGRGQGYEGLWLHTKAPPSELRRRDNFLEYFRRHMSSCTLVDVELDQADRIVKISYQKFGALHSFLLFWRARKLYFLHHYQDAPETPHKIMLSWGGKAFIPGEDSPNLYDYFNEVGRKSDMKQDLVSLTPISIQDLIESELKASDLSGIKVNPTFLQRKKDNIEDDLRKTKQWEKLQAILDEGKSLDQFYELKVDDQKIKFEGDLNPYERRNLLFQKIKKLKRGETILAARLDQVKDQLVGKNTTQEIKSKLPIIKPVWGKEDILPQKSLVPEASSADYKIYKYDNFQLGVGTTARGNDQLRSQWGSKEDYWIHLDGHKSAHVVVKLLGKETLTPDILNLGATIVARFSHFNDDWIPIIYTQVKNLKGVSGAAGMVIYKKEKHLRCPKVSLGEEFKE